MSRRLSPIVQDTRNGAASPAPAFGQQSPSGTSPATTMGEDTLLVARSLIRLASESSPSSLPTTETLEMAAAAYQVAMRIHHPNPSFHGTDNPTKIEGPPGQLAVIEDFHKELKAIRAETSQAFRRLDEKFEALRGDIESLKLHTSPIERSIEKSPEAASLQSPEAASLQSPEAASQIEDVNAGVVYIESEDEDIGPSWDFDAEPTTTQTTTGYTLEPKQLQTIEEVEEGVGSPAVTPPRGREPVGSFQASKSKQTPASPEANKQPMDENRSESLRTFFKVLLNTLTPENFDAASNRIIKEMNKSDSKTNTAAVKVVADLVFETAINEVRSPGICARLCKKIVENLSGDIKDENMRDPAGELVLGGLLFRKYLLVRCQDYFERGWSTTGPRGAQNIEDAPKIRRQGLGLVRFFGELFKLQMLNERIMHECIKKLLSKVYNPDEGEVESMCILLTNVGRELDTATGKVDFDIYFGRIQTLADRNKVSAELKSALLDLIELRKRGWRPRNATTGPSSFSQVVKEPVASPQQASTKEWAAPAQRTFRTDPKTRDEPRRGGRGGLDQGPDGWNVAGSTPFRAPTKAGDLSNFGKFTANSGPLKTMGPSSVFKRSDRGRDNSQSPTGSLSPTTTGSNGYSGGSGADAEDTTSQKTQSGEGTPRKMSDDAPLRRKLQLLPRSVSSTNTNADSTSDGGTSESKEEEVPTKSYTDEEVPIKSYTDEEANAKVEEDVKEFFQIQDLIEGEKYFADLPDEHKSKLVQKLVSGALELKEAEVKLVSQLFEKVAGEACQPAAFEEGVTMIMEFLDDTGTDVPQVYDFMARMLRGSKLPQETVESLADKISVDGDPEVKPKDKLLKAYAALVQ